MDGLSLGIGEGLANGMGKDEDGGCEYAPSGDRFGLGSDESPRKEKANGVTEEEDEEEDKEVMENKKGRTRKKAMKKKTTMKKEEDV